MGLSWEYDGNEKAFILENISYKKGLNIFSGKVLGWYWECLRNMTGMREFLKNNRRIKKISRKNEGEKE